MQTSKAEGGAVKANHDLLKLVGTVLAIVAIFGAMGVAWGTAQTQIGDLERRTLSLELESLATENNNLEILVRLERIETTLEYISERVSRSESIPESPSAPPSS